MENHDIQSQLIAHGIKPTPNRILVARQLNQARRPMSLADLEESLGSLDRASIFRVLELFAKEEFVHVIEDGSRSLKYEMCHGSDHHSPSDQHVHFYCTECKEIFCLEDCSIPQIEIPEGFQTRSVNFVLKGLCPRCSRRLS